MSLTVYWGSGSPHSWRVLLTLVYKRIGYESQCIEDSQGDHHPQAFLTVNPRGTVPAIDYDGYCLSESLAIMSYLDEKHPHPPLFGKKPEQTGQIWRLISELESYLAVAIQRVTGPLSSGEAIDQREDVRSAMNDVHDELRRLEKLLAGRRFLVGSTLTAADFVLFPMVQSLLHAADLDDAKPLKLKVLPLDEHYPALDAWAARVQGIPGYDSTYPPDWR